jgi:tRNA threonylcarbamoyladenosine biosynthesis protein TsaB
MSVFACLDARMREVYVAFYAREADDWRVVRAPAVEKPDVVVVPHDHRWQGEGDGFAVYPALAKLPGVTSACADAIPTARAIGELALPMIAHGQGVPAADARPLYVRHRVALTTAERAAGERL